MVASGAYLGGLLADNNVSAVAAFPDTIVVAAENNAILDVLQQLQVALLVVLLDSGYQLKLGCNLGETFLTGFLGHVGVHVGPLIVLACGGVLEVIHGVTNLATVQVFEPKFGVFFLIEGCFLEESGYLLVAIFLRFGSVV